VESYVVVFVWSFKIYWSTFCYYPKKYTSYVLQVWL